LQNPLCPPELDVIVLKALAKYRDDRFQTGSEMADALDDVVHAARFQPSHLAQLMRDLFPAEAGGGESRNPTASARINQTLTGSSSRPYSQAMRSPTIPPVSRPASTVRGLQGHEASSVVPPRPRPFYRRGSVWITAALVIAAFLGGAVWMQGAAPQVQPRVGTPEGKPRTLLQDLPVQTIPDGADVYILDTNEHIGKTPFRRQFEWREDKPTILLFRLPGYEEVTREVKPTWTGLIRLRPLVRARGKPGERPADKDRTDRTDERPPSSPSASPATPAPAGETPPPSAGAPAPAGGGTPGGRIGDPSARPAPATALPHPPAEAPPAGPRRRGGKKAQKAGELIDPF
jgi:hypothetical protein